MTRAQTRAQIGSQARAQFGTWRRARGAAWLWTLLIVLGAGGIASAVYFTRSSGSGKAGDRTADRAVTRRESFEITTTAGGELEAKNRVEVRSQLERESTIVSIVPEGARVAKGELLVQLNSDEIKRQLDESAAQVESAKASLISAENAYKIQESENASKARQAQLKLDMAELALQKWLEGEVAMKRQENRLRIDKATLELERLADKFAKSQELLAQGFLSKDETDRDEVSYIQAISEWKTSQLSAEVYERYEFAKDMKSRQSDVDEAKAELQRVLLTNSSELASKAANKANQTQQLAFQEARLAKHTQQFAATTIHAPQDGLVVYSTSIERNRWGMGGSDTLQIGQQVYPNQMLIVLPDTSEMVAAVRVHESIAGRIKPGMAASVRVDAVGGRTFSGKVSTIGVLAESGGWRDPNLREYTVRIGLEIQDAAAVLKPSMRVEARIVMGGVADALTVPIQAVFQEGPVRFVYAEKSGRFTRVPVKLGRRSDTLAEIGAGLEEGREVLLREPKPGETITAAWEKAQLELAGYKVGEDGKPLASGPEGGAPGGGRPNGGRRGENAAKPEGTSDADATKPDTNTDAKADTKADTKAEAKPDGKTDGKAETKPAETKAQAPESPKPAAPPAGK